MKQIQNVKLKIIKTYDKNTKKHPKDQIERIAKSIKEFGFNTPILLNKDNVLIAGHGRLQAAKILQLKEIPALYLNDLTKEQIKAYRIADNKTAESEWDYDFLKEEFQDLQKVNYDLSLTGFTDDDLKELNLEDINIDSVVEEDDFEEDIIELKTNIKDGDIFKLGNHRLMCGDSTDFAKVIQLTEAQKIDMCFTDPPYNTGMTESSDSTWLNHMFNDSYTEDEWSTFMDKFCSIYYKVLKDDAVAYICLDWRRNYELIPFIKKAGFNYSNCIVWDKVVHGLGSDYKYTYELINVCKKGKPVLNTHQGDREYSDVWHIQRKIGKDDEHATKKPLELITRALKHNNLCKTVIDLFGGSGSTLIACEQLNRNCYMMELDPKYVQTIINRWEKLTGKKAKKLN